MKKIWICLLIAWILPNALAADSTLGLKYPVLTVSEFNALFRVLDLNAAMQNGYAITKTEYDWLKIAWQGLSEEDQSCLLSQECGWGDFAEMFVFDIYLGTSWEDHVRKAIDYGALGVSLTESGHNNVLYVQKARRTLVDWIRQTPIMLRNGQLIVSQHIDSEIARRIGRKGLKRLHRWESLINEYQGGSDAEKLESVSRFFANRIIQAPDAGGHRGNEYWQSPIETLIRGRGDCDDFAMAHYVSLRLLGIPADQLRIAIMKGPANTNHGVVFYYPEGESDPWVVDNLFSERLGVEGGLILLLSVRMRLDHLQPLWVMNEYGFSEFREEGLDVLVLKTSQDHLPAFARALDSSRSLLPTHEEFFAEGVAGLK